MLNELGLKGSELLIYATIYGFSMGQGMFTGSSSDLSEWAPIQKRQCLNILKKLTERKLIHKIQKLENGIKKVYYVAPQKTLDKLNMSY